MRPQYEQAGCVMIRKALEAGEAMNVLDAVALTRCHRSTCRDYLAVLHGAKLTHITRWVQTNQRGRWYPVYAWGKGEDEDAPKPGRDERLARRRIKRTVDSHGITISMLLGVGR